MNKMTDNYINKLRELMHDKGISFLIVPTSDPHGSEYIADAYKYREEITGFSGSAGTFVLSDKEAALFVDGRYHIQADNETAGTEITVYKLGVNGVPDVTEYIESNVKAGDVIALDGRIVTEADYERYVRAANGAEFVIDDYFIDEVLKLKNATFSDITGLPVSVSGESTENKLSKVREYIKANRADAFFVSALDDVCWLFNIRGRDVKYGTVVFSYAYITADSATLYINEASAGEALKGELAAQGVFISDYSCIEQELYKIKGKKVLCDREYTSCYFAKIIGLGNEIKYIKNYNAVKKHIKNETEQALARKHHITDAVSVIKFLSEIRELPEHDEYSAGALLDKIRASGDDFYDLSFDTICAYAENAAIVHYSAPARGSKKLENKGLILIDSGAHYTGATTDVTRTVALGPVTDDEKKAYTLVLKGNLSLMSAVFVKGTRCENLDILARKPLWAEGLDYRHGTGHGIGAFLNVHEGPYRISYKISDRIPQPEIEPGMIISDEPGYYEEGKYGIRHETQLLCVKKAETGYGEFYGFEPLTLIPFDRDCIDFSLLTHEELGVLREYYGMIRTLILPLLSGRSADWLIYNTDI